MYIMKKDILIIANFTRLPCENGNSRFPYIANLIDSEKYNVELITSTFSHAEKKQRENNNDERIKYKITLLKEPGYKKNVSVKRFFSHHIFAINLKKYLKKRPKPDIIYCAIPSLSVGKVVAKYTKKNNIRFIIDIQDLWPEAFKMVLNIPIISNILFYPMKRDADYIYSSADEIVAVSETYCNRALKVNKKVKNGLSVFLGTDLQYFDECAKKNKIEFNDNIIRIAYIGTLGHSYNIPIVIDAIRYLNDKGINNIRLIVMGDGPLKMSFEKYAKEKRVDCEFTGRLKYEKMVGLLCSCDIAVNPIKSGSAGSIINKVGDYAAAGLPVINTQENNEYRNLVEKYEIGYNSSNEDLEDIVEKLEKLIENKETRERIGKNNRKLAEEKFDRRKTYDEIVEIIGRK